MAAQAQAPAQASARQQLARYTTPKGDERILLARRASTGGVRAFDTPASRTLSERWLPVATDLHRLTDLVAELSCWSGRRRIGWRWRDARSH